MLGEPVGGHIGHIGHIGCVGGASGPPPPPGGGNPRVFFGAAAPLGRKPTWLFLGAAAPWDCVGGTHLAFWVAEPPQDQPTGKPSAVAASRFSEEQRANAWGV